MSLSGKALGVKIIIGNTIALMLYAFFIASSNYPSISFSAPESINGSPVYNPETYQVNYEAPKTSISIIDLMLAFYFVMSYGVAVWLIVNPFSG